MLKSDAIRLLGGTNRSAADACRISLQAVSVWPDVLTRDIEDRVLAALARKHLSPEQLGAVPAAVDPQPDFVDTLPAPDTGEHAHAVDIPIRGDGTVTENERFEHRLAAKVPAPLGNRFSDRVRVVLARVTSDKPR